MPVSEADRRLIFTNLAEAHGEEVANKIMELLPRHASGELATRNDLDAMAMALRGEMAELRGDVRSEIAGLQRWIAGIFATNAVALVTAIVT